MAKYVRDVHDDYISALRGQFEHANLAALYCLDFSRHEPSVIYSTDSVFQQEIVDRADDPDKLAKEVDADLNNYWRAALTGLLDSHQALRAEYTKRFGDGSKRKHHIYLHGKSGLKHIDYWAGALPRVANSLPKYAFNSPSDVKYWGKMARICIPAINKVFQIDSEIVSSAKDIDKARAERTRQRLNIFAQTSGAVEAGVKFLLGLPG